MVIAFREDISESVHLNFAPCPYQDSMRGILATLLSQTMCADFWDFTTAAQWLRLLLRQQYFHDRQVFWKRKLTSLYTIFMGLANQNDL